MTNNKTFAGIEYDEDFMCESIKKLSKAKQDLEDANDEYKDYKAQLEDIEEQVDFLTVKINNIKDEWGDFQPFQDELKKLKYKRPEW